MVAWRQWRWEFNNAVSISDCIASNYMMIDEYRGFERKRVWPDWLFILCILDWGDPWKACIRRGRCAAEIQTENLLSTNVEGRPYCTVVWERNLCFTGNTSRNLAREIVQQLWDLFRCFIFLKRQFQTQQFCVRRRGEVGWGDRITFLGSPSSAYVTGVPLTPEATFMN
jgi:hypothetical protein